jgi:hypothetical protein
MPRALSIKRSIVPLSERAKYLERLKARKDYYKKATCEFWVFEEAALTGAFIEFVEAADAETLEAAHGAAPEPVLDPARIYTEVELT